MSKILLADLSVNFAMDHEHEKLRMKGTTNKLVRFISSLNFGSKEMPIQEYVQLARDKLLMQSITWLSSWIWHGVEKSIWI
jgi:hypothetical protein